MSTEREAHTWRLRAAVGLAAAVGLTLTGCGLFTDAERPSERAAREADDAAGTETEDAAGDRSGPEAEDDRAVQVETLPIPETCEEVGFEEAAMSRIDWEDAGAVGGRDEDDDLSCQVIAAADDDAPIPLPRILSLTISTQGSAVDEPVADFPDDAPDGDYYETEMTKRFGGIAEYEGGEALLDSLDYHLPGVLVSVDVLGDTIGQEEIEKLTDELVEAAAG
ncbi:hypothetical protein HNR23_001817 [Nocardiopsis mwathae]|uniref:Uncharacterized protein n=1 Tax=Nocardiopsis mwathae TaxID=1472723 RepID=A0A7W9YGL9_9ACTN|nr:hypothetical protein [Nocardiopsis mwathae]MBB6171757.1 hypothetical protein [Nocardiopsis mwathae]